MMRYIVESVGELGVESNERRSEAGEKEASDYLNKHEGTRSR